VFAGVNWLAVVLAMVGAMVVGATWYSPALFAKAWMAELGKSPEQMGKAIPAMINAVVVFLIAATVMAILFRELKVASVPDALATAALLWVGFTASMQLLADRFQGASIKLSLIDAGNTLLSFLAMGAILALMG
jgi:hypothetical protein